ncbi:hypothetical protein DSM112329_03502 [Paraconexibacter sp. AEG42_29]|uniref:Uncharacterized protein n=1 Tax=Paraconexibacter sp. AEG42_29 TaxID=2997339 RepID=A0AAU7AYB2_9ACTN
MYQFSRAIYRELAKDIADVHATGRNGHEAVLKACEATMDRLSTDRHYFAKPARTLFNDIRPYFPMNAQARVWLVVERYIACAEEWLQRQPRHGYDANGNPLQCRATTRRGTACQREPLPRNGYCPSHQHLAETEQCEVQALAA